MKMFKVLLSLLMVTTSLSVLAQSKGEMPFTSSSPNANKLIRSAWTLFADAKIDEANSYVHQALTEDPNCGMAYASLTTTFHTKSGENIQKAQHAQLSPNEKLFVDGVTAVLENRPAQDFFMPLIKKYPRDEYLHLLIMFFMLHEQEPAIEIGENLIRRNPKFAPAYNLLGYGYMQQNDMAKAQAHFDKYISLRPDLANPYDSKGDFMMHAGKTEEAIQLYEKALSLGMAASKIKAEEAKAKIKYPQLSEEAIVEIKEIISTSIDAIDQNDADAAVKYYSDQAVKIWGNQGVNVGVSNVKQGFSTAFTYRNYARFDGSIHAVNGVGPIAIAYGTCESLWKEVNSAEETTQNENFIFLLRKTDDQSWKILADHYYGDDHGEPLSDDDMKSVKQLLADWDHALQSGSPLTEEQLQYYASLHSSQIIEIYSNQVSNVGTGNLLARVEDAVGITFEKSSLNPVSVEGLGRRAVAWGIASQILYLKDSDEPISRQYPWIMILTKEKDDVWRVLVVHWD